MLVLKSPTKQHSENIVEKLHLSKIKMLQEKDAGQKIWVSVDETTDIEQRFVACFIFRIMGASKEREKKLI